MNIAVLRPSNILRTAENTVGLALAVIGGTAMLAGRGVANGARRAKAATAEAAHNVSIEMEARARAKLYAQFEEEQRLLRTLPAAERAQYEADIRAIRNRTDEILRERLR
jgi:hypothetical protein